MKQLVLLYAVITVLVGITLWALFREEPEDPIVAARADSLATLKAQLSSVEGRLEIVTGGRTSAERRADSLKAVLDTTSVRIRTVRVETTRRAAEAGENLEASFDSLRLSVTPNLITLVDTTQFFANVRDNQRQQAIVLLEDELTLNQEIVIAERNVSGRLRLEGIQKDTIITNLNSQLGIAFRDSEFWRDEARPSFFGRFADRWKTYTTGAIVGGMVVCILTCSD